MLLEEKESINYTKYDKELKHIDKHINVNRVSLEQLNKINVKYNNDVRKDMNVTSLINLAILHLLKDISLIESDEEAFQFIKNLSEEFKVYEVLHKINEVEL